MDGVGIEQGGDSGSKGVSPAVMRRQGCGVQDRIGFLGRRSQTAR